MFSSEPFECVFAAELLLLPCAFAVEILESSESTLRAHYFAVGAGLLAVSANPFSVFSGASTVLAKDGGELAQELNACLDLHC